MPGGVFCFPDLMTDTLHVPVLLRTDPRPRGGGASRRGRHPGARWPRRCLPGGRRRGAGDRSRPRCHRHGACATRRRRDALRQRPVRLARGRRGGARLPSRLPPPRPRRLLASARRREPRLHLPTWRAARHADGSGRAAGRPSGSRAWTRRSSRQVLRDYGDEPKARRMAAEIVRRRETAALRHQRRPGQCHPRRPGTAQRAR